MLNAGSKAPQFTLASDDSSNVSLKDFLGKKVVLYFYPRDSTPGCTREACSGKIAHIFPKVKIDGHTEEVLKKLSKM